MAFNWDNCSKFLIPESFFIEENIQTFPEYDLKLCLYHSYSTWQPEAAFLIVLKTRWGSVVYSLLNSQRTYSKVRDTSRLVHAKKKHLLLSSNHTTWSLCWFVSEKLAWHLLVKGQKIFLLQSTIFIVLPCHAIEKQHQWM